ncbi:MAG TPA: hypothetical protein PLZ08_12740 [Bacillota bacterium]|jgi:hypothetical protein|nr:hypothetical protein [Bacillota bacterium]HPO98805.1 hypothetical protein [Bacillota bacterium]
MRLFKGLLKKWYLIPVLVFAIYLILRIFLHIYIQPVVLEEGNITWLLKSKSFKLNVECNYLGGEDKIYKYRIISEPQGLLEEEWYSATDLLLSHPVGMVFGNFDFDREKEVLVLGCEGWPSKTVIPGLIDSIRKYYGKDEVMGYYDFQGDKFSFKRIEDNPFSNIIFDWYIDFLPDGNLMTAMSIYGFFSVLLTGVFALLNLLVVRMYRFFCKKKGM